MHILTKTTDTETDAMAPTAKKITVVRKNTKPAAPKASQFTPWTAAQVQILKDAVAAAPTAVAGFKVAAKKLGKNVGTVGQKWYKLKAETQPKPKASAKAEAAPITPEAHPAQRNMYKWMQGRISDIDAKIADLSAKKASIQSVVGEFERAVH
jgi:hypothetical protein